MQLYFAGATLPYSLTSSQRTATQANNSAKIKHTEGTVNKEDER
jgi:hypothetical protein